jgi:hypothetical protein
MDRHRHSWGAGPARHGLPPPPASPLPRLMTQNARPPRLRGRQRPRHPMARLRRERCRAARSSRRSTSVPTTPWR